MAYLDIAEMTRSGSLLGRLTAAAAQEQAAGAALDPRDPASWTGTYLWHLVSAPGWGDAWASAVASGHDDPGADAAVITDAEILAQTQAVIAAVAA